jgi:hypothetical protein
VATVDLYIMEVEQQNLTEHQELLIQAVVLAAAVVIILLLLVRLAVQA